MAAHLAGSSRSIVRARLYMHNELARRSQDSRSTWQASRLAGLGKDSLARAYKALAVVMRPQHALCWWSTDHLMLVQHYTCPLSFRAAHLLISSTGQTSIKSLESFRET